MGMGSRLLEGYVCLFLLCGQFHLQSIVVEIFLEVLVQELGKLLSQQGPYLRVCRECLGDSDISHLLYGLILLNRVILVQHLDKVLAVQIVNGCLVLICELLYVAPKLPRHPAVHELEEVE